MTGSKSRWSPGLLVTPVVRLPPSYEGKGPILRGDDDPEPEGEGGPLVG
jgi:hypothetical protein